MKKFLTKLLVLVVTFITVIVFECFAGIADIEFGDPKVVRGKTFDLVIKVKSKDVKLASSDITIHYEADKIEFVSGNDAEGGSGMVRINGKGKGSGTTTIEYRLQFKALSAGETRVTLQTYEVTDKNDNPVNIEHKGSSTVTIKSATTTSKNNNLKSLEVQPGELMQTFDPNVLEYTCEVNADVDALVINALKEDNDAKVEIKGNENLRSGENIIEIIVTAPNDVNKKTYTLRATKLETGTTPGGVSVVDGQRIISEQYYVTYMDFPEDVEIFDGYTETSAYLSNSDQLSVWVEEGNDDPQYCILYGMDKNGDIGFYRYDKYKYTLQRNFQDPGSESLRTQAMNEQAAIESYNQVVSENRLWAIATICLGIFSIILIIVLIVILAKKNDSKTRYFNKNNVLDDEDEEEEDDDDFFGTKNEKTNKFSITKPTMPVEKKFEDDDEIDGINEEFGDIDDDEILDNQIEDKIEKEEDDEIINENNYDVEDLD